MILSKLTTYLIVLLAGVVLGVGATTWFMKSGEIRALNGKIRAMSEARGAADRRNLEIVSELNGALEDNRRRIADLQREVNVHVPDNSMCDLTRGAVGVLNYSYTGLPDPATVTDAEKASTSTITQRTHLQRHIADIGEYNSCMAQLNALIEAVR